jgi:two-component system OmpR family response regulator
MTTPDLTSSLRRQDGSALRVLVVDDEQMLTDLLSMALRMEGWDVRTAGSGLQALQAARDFDPDAMVLDIMMPDLDGMAVLQRLRHSGNDVPVLFLTAKDSVGDLTLNEDSHEVERDGDAFELTATEFELLRFLMRNQRRVVSKAQILDRVWNYDFGGRSSVDELYISYLRKKIDQGREPLIHTVRGVGYMIKAPQ